MYALILAACVNLQSLDLGEAKCAANVIAVFKTAKECSQAKQSSTDVKELYSEATKEYTIVTKERPTACIKLDHKEKVIKKGRVVLEKK